MAWRARLKANVTWANSSVTGPADTARSSANAKAHSSTTHEKTNGRFLIAPRLAQPGSRARPSSSARLPLPGDGLCRDLDPFPNAKLRTPKAAEANPGASDSCAAHQKPAQTCHQTLAGFKRLKLVGFNLDRERPARARLHLSDR